MYHAPLGLKSLKNHNLKPPAFLSIKNIKFLKMEHFNKLLSRWRLVCFVCPHEAAHVRSYECITGIMYAQTYIHVPRNKLSVARFYILMNLIFTYLISWNKPVQEIMVPIAYASSEGSDEPGHPWKMANTLTAHIHIEGACPNFWKYSPTKWLWI